MTGNNIRKSRRNLLKSVATSSSVVIVGKSLPEYWVKPVVDSVMLPAHAQASPPTTIPPNSCTQCGEQMLTDGIGGASNWNSRLVNYNSNENSYQFLVGSFMQQFVVLSDSCIGSTLRLNLADGGGTGPLKVSVAIGNTVKDTTYTGGGLILDVPVPAGPTTPAFVDIRFDGTPFDINTKILEPTLTVIC